MQKRYRTINDVVDSKWAEHRALFEKENTDRVLKSTKLEDSIYDDLRSNDEVMENIEREGGAKLKTFPALSRDIYQSFYSISPRRTDATELSPTARKFNRHILEHVMEHDDYPTLKNICEGRDMLSYEAASEFTARTVEELDGLLGELGGDKGTLHTLEKLEASTKNAARELQKTLERYRSEKNIDEQAVREIVSIANQLDSKQRQVEAVSRMIDAQITHGEDRLNKVISSALSGAKDKVEEAQRIIGAWSDEPANVSRNQVNMDLLNKVRKSKTLLDISKYLGRFREILAQGKKNGYAYGRGENYSIELGNNISRAITSELAALAIPATIPLFLQKYRNKQIKQYKRRELVFKGMGDIICCLDESGSTEGDKAAWGKAVAMALLEIAADSKRKFALIHFAGSGSVRTDVFLPGAYSVEDRLNAAEMFLGGGTNFETPLIEAVELMKNQSFEKADIVFITDGECELADDFLMQLREKQIEKGFTVTGILLDEREAYMDFSLKPFCQNIYRTSELIEEEIVRAIVGTRV